jgi:elongation factor Ts
MATDASITRTLAKETGHNIDLCKLALERSRNDVNNAKRLMDKWTQSPVVKKNDPGLVAAYYEKEAPAASVVSLTSNDAFFITTKDCEKLLKDITTELAYCDDFYVEKPTLDRLQEQYGCIINIDFGRIEKTTPFSLLTAYAHRDKIGVVIETTVSNEKAFNNRAFRIFSYELALHIAAFNPHSISANDIAEPMLDLLKKHIEKELMSTCKPMSIWPDIVRGRISKWAENHTLLNQTFIKSDKDSVNSIKQSVEKIIESEITIKQFKRLSLEKNGNLANI